MHLYNTDGPAYNEYSGISTSVVTLDDLFEGVFQKAMYHTLIIFRIKLLYL